MSRKRKPCLNMNFEHASLQSKFFELNDFPSGVYKVALESSWGRKSSGEEGKGKKGREEERKGRE